MVNRYIKDSGIKEYFKTNKMKVSGDFAEELDKKIEILLSQALFKAKFNKRKTVMSGDL